MPIEATPIAGEVRLKLQLKDVKAIKNPEAFGRAEWDLRLWINGIERWRTDKLIRVGEGETVSVGAEILTDVAADTHEVELKLEGAERDLLSRDERAVGTARLDRLAGFEKDRGLVVDVHGPGAHLKVAFGVDVATL